MNFVIRKRCGHYIRATPFLTNIRRKKQMNELKWNKKIKASFTIFVLGVLYFSFGISNVMAAGDPLTAVNNFSTFIFALIRAIGIILLGFGVVQVGLSLKSHDPSQRANGFLTLAGGIVITFAKEILDIIIG